MDNSKNRLAINFNKARAASEHADYSTANEKMSLDDKKRILKSLGREELIDLFKEWKPRKAYRRTTAPLDQRITLTISSLQRQKLENELRVLRQSGEKVSLAHIIRSRCITVPDMEVWGPLAKEALDKLDYVVEHKAELEQRRLDLSLELENSDDDDFENAPLITELNQVNTMINSLVPVNTQRSCRLSGRMTFNEATLVKHRAAQLCLSVSDFLRMTIFDLKPGSPGTDQHMSLDAKRRFYISVLSVQQTGFSAPPELYQCSQCQEYADEINRLRKEIAVLRDFTE